MKKLMLLGVIGAMFVASQSLIFANAGKADQNQGGEKAVEIVSLAQSIEETPVGVVELIKSTEAQKVSDEKPMSAEEAKQFAGVLGLDTSELQKQKMTEFLNNLSQEDIEKLIDAGILATMEASTMTEAVSVE